MLKLIPSDIENETFESLGNAIYRHKSERADVLAVITEDRQVTWAEFGEMVAQVAGKLSSLGMKQGSFVATLSENSIENLVTFCAILVSGACAVPLPFSATQEALTGMAADSGASILFASPAQLSVARNLGVGEVVDLSEVMTWSSDSPKLQAPVEVQTSDLFNIIYSSGTTGLPKGIVHNYLIRARQLHRFRAFGVTKDTRFLISMPIYSNGTLFGVLPTLAFGGTILLMSKFSTTGFLKLSQDHKATHTVMVPVQYMRLMAEPTFDDYDLSSYECKFSLAAPLSHKLIGETMERWPGNMIEVYGMTEGGLSTSLNCQQFPDKWDTIGKPGMGIDVRVIDEDGKELPKGEIGELIGRAPVMMSHYHNQPEKTAEIIWRDADGNHFIRTGDMGWLDDDGFIHLSDRKKDMIISGGFNIYAADLEAVLQDHPEVTECAVIAVPSEDWGETPLAVVVTKSGFAGTGEEIRDWANAKLGKTQRLSAVEVRPELPRSEIGKVLKNKLRDEFAARA